MKMHHLEYLNTRSKSKYTETNFKWILNSCWVAFLGFVCYSKYCDHFCHFLHFKLYDISYDISFSENDAKLEDIKEFVESALLVKDLKHENILPIIGVAFPPPKAIPLVVLPLMAHGDLKSLLLKPEMVRIEAQGKDEWHDVFFFHLSIKHVS